MHHGFSVYDKRERKDSDIGNQLPGENEDFRMMEEQAEEPKMFNPTIIQNNQLRPPNDSAGGPMLMGSGDSFGK